jgi:tetratricopeptide (TPR) repeat protein
LLAEALAQEGRTDRARRLLLALSREKKPPAEAMHRLGMIFFEEGAHEEALRWFRRSIALHANDYYSRIYCARSYLELGRFADASRVLEEAKGIASTAEVHYLLGTALLRRQEPQKAISFFKEAIERNADYTEAVFSLAEAYRKLGQEEAADAALARFQELHRADQSLLETANRLEQKCQQHTEDVRGRCQLARLYIEQGRFQEGERWAWKAIQIDPQNTEVRLLLAGVLRRQGFLNGAALHYRKILRRNPDHLDARRELEALIRRHGRRTD